MRFSIRFDRACSDLNMPSVALIQPPDIPARGAAGGTVSVLVDLQRGFTSAYKPWFNPIDKTFTNGVADLEARPDLLIQRMISAYDAPTKANIRRRALGCYLLI